MSLFFILKLFEQTKRSFFSLKSCTYVIGYIFPAGVFLKYFKSFFPLTTTHNYYYFLINIYSLYIIYIYLPIYLLILE